MSIFKKNVKIGNVYKGSTKIGKIYKGNQLVYSAGYWLTQEGYPLILANSLGKNLKDYKIYGNIYQETTGKNLVDFYNIDKWQKIAYAANVLELDLPANVTITTNFTEGSNNYLYYQYYSEEEQKWINPGGEFNLIQAATKRVPFTFNTGTTKWRLWTYSSDNHSGFIDFINSIKNFQIELGIIPTEYESFVRKATPEQPSKIESVGDKSKNLFNINTMAERFYAYLNSYNNTWQYAGDSATFRVPVKGNTTYTIYASTLSSIFRVACAETDTVPVSGTPITIYNFTENTNKQPITVTTTENTKYLIIQLGATMYPSILPNLQVEEGTSVSEYGAFGYRIPVKIGSKNLVDFYNIDKWETVGTQRKRTELQLPQHTDITINFSSAPTGYLYLWRYNEETQDWESPGTTHNLIQNTTKRVPFTFNTGTSRWSFWAYKGAGVEEFINSITRLQVEIGDTATEYEPYVQPTITNIYLDEPLRKIGDYFDYIDFANKKVVRNIFGEHITNVSGKSSVTGTHAIFLTPLTKTPKFINQTGYAVSNKFLQNTGAYNDLINKGGYIQSYITTGGANRIAYTFNDNSIDTVEKAQEKIGDGFEVCYVLETPEEKAIELPHIRTSKPTTTILLDTKIPPSNMSATYKASKKG